MTSATRCTHQGQPMFYLVRFREEALKDQLIRAEHGSIMAARDHKAMMGFPRRPGVGAGVLIVAGVECMSDRKSPVVKRRVIFICTGNACRSQMAEGLLRHMAGDHFDVVSGGTHPWLVHPLAIEVMAEQGIDISGHHSKSVDEFVDQQFDYVVTTCDRASEACPAFPGDHERLHWSIDDPIYAQGNREAQLQEFRRVRDEIARRIAQFVAQASVRQHEA